MSQGERMGDEVGMQKLSPPECQPLGDLIWPSTCVAPAPSAEHHRHLPVLSTYYMSGPGVGSGDARGNQIDKCLFAGTDLLTHPGEERLGRRFSQVLPSPPSLNPFKFYTQPQF